MKKLFIPLLFIGYALFTQSCKKAVSDYVTSNPYFQADINNTVWTPDTVSASIIYNAATNTQTFSCMGTMSQKQVSISVSQRGGATSTGFPLATYVNNSNSAQVVNFTYAVQQKNSSGAYVFVPQGTVKPGSGSVTITAVDTVKKTITGSFNFTPTISTYDNNGNLTSLTVYNVTAGTFNALPYTFTKQ